MSLLDDFKTYSRFAWGLRSYLGKTLTLDQAKTIIQDRMVNREPAFLRMVERGIYGYARSPYLALLKQAQCEFGDLQAMLKSKGLEPTLRALHDAGVYVTFEEFKGRAPLVRFGREFPTRPSDFDNPYLSHTFYKETGGSTGVGSRVPLDLDHIDARLANTMILEATHGLTNMPALQWRGILPDSTGIVNLLRTARLGNMPQRWYTPLTEKDVKSDFKNRLATWYIIGLGRALGHPFPWPEPLPLEQAGVIAQWASQTLKTHGRCLLRMGISLAVRVAVAAKDAGLDLTGAVFQGGAEPVTPAKVKAITDVGGRHIPIYAFVETGHVGFGCANPADVNDLHFMKDYLALIQAPRQVPGSDLTVDAFCYTTLLTTAPKIFLNVESDDYGVVESRACGCLMHELGYTEHLRHVRSYRKLTGEGVTLIGSDMVRILEEVLPSRFGGSPQDYQIQEEEDAAGFTRLNLIIHPRVLIQDEAAVIAAVMEALRLGNPAAVIAQALWSKAQTLRVKRAEPIWTARGKLNPLHLAHRPAEGRSISPSN